MIISPDNANLNTSVAGAGSSNPFKVQQAGSWMNELERALLSEQPVQQEVQDSNVGSNASDDNVNAASANLQPNGLVTSGQDEGPFQSSASSVDVNELSEKVAELKNGNDGNNASQGSIAHCISTTNTLRDTDSASTANTLHGTDGKPLAGTKQSLSGARTTAMKTRQDVATPGFATLSPAVALAIPLATPSAAVLMQQIKHYQDADEIESLQSASAINSISHALSNPSSSPQISGSAAAQQKAGNAGDEPVSFSQETTTANPSASETEAYPERQLHVFQSDDGVQAWIRDASLSQSQAYAVGQAMDSELRNSGMKLNGLVLNGKKVAGLYQGNLVGSSQASTPVAQQLGETSEVKVAMQQEFNKKGVI